MPRANTPSEHTRKPLCPSLPPEIWINIFSYHSDLAHLWNTCRLISPTLRACAERAFGENFLKDVHIEFLLDRHNLGGKRGPHEPAVYIEFARLGKGVEEGTAWFRGHFRGHKVVDPWMRDRTKGVIMQRWHENNEKRKPELPNYTISIGGMVNDTDIPGLEIDREEYEARLDWRGMLQLFFREEERLRALKAEWLDSHALSQQLAPRRGKGSGCVSVEPSPHRGKGSKRASAEPAPSWQDIEIDLRKDIRRTRLKKHYHDNAEMVWAIDSLKCFEKADSSKWSSISPKMLPHLPGAGLGERWFGSTNLVQELYLDECSSMNRIDTQMRLVSKQASD